MVRRIDLALSFLVMLLILSLVSCSPAATVTATPQPATATPAASATPEPALTETTAPAAGAPVLRIRNTSDYDFKNLVVLFPEGRLEFGDVPAGATTEYVEAPGGVYNFAAYEFDLDGETYTQYVRDWMGESPREGSSFTYVIDFEGAGTDRPLITLVEVQTE